MGIKMVMAQHPHARQESLYKPVSKVLLSAASPEPKEFEVPGGRDAEKPAEI
jgi:hypothetical protein